MRSTRERVDQDQPPGHRVAAEARPSQGRSPLRRSSGGAPPPRPSPPSVKSRGTGAPLSRLAGGRACGPRLQAGGEEAHSPPHPRGGQRPHHSPEGTPVPPRPRPPVRDENAAGPWPAPRSGPFRMARGPPGGRGGRAGGGEPGTGPSLLAECCPPPGDGARRGELYRPGATWHPLFPPPVATSATSGCCLGRPGERCGGPTYDVQLTMTLREARSAHGWVDEKEGRGVDPDPGK